MVTAVYEEKLADAKKQVKIEYKFVPRTFYEEQLGENGNLMEKVGDIFAKESPWFYQTVGGLEDNPLERKIHSDKAVKWISLHFLFSRNIIIKWILKKGYKEQVIIVF